LADKRRQSTRRTGFVAAAAAALVALIAWATLSGPSDIGPANQPSPTASGEPSLTPMPDDWPYLLDVRTGVRTPLPRRIVPDNQVEGTVYAFRPGTRQLARASSCEASPSGCPGGSAPIVVNLDTAEVVQRLRIPQGLDVGGISWSPDGTKMLYSATEGSFMAVPELYVHDLQTDRSRKVTNVPPDAANWSLTGTFSADGSSVLYDAPRDSDGTRRWDVWSVPLSGGPAHVIVPNAKTPTAIPGTTDVVVLRPIPGAWEGSAIVRPMRTILVAMTSIGTVRASPDGTRLAYDDDGSAWVVDIATGLATRLADGRPGGWLDDETLLILPQS
jgi:hypothetical protein